MIPTISYTQRDFHSIRTALVDWIKVRFEHDWKEFIDTSVGKAIIDIVAWAHSQRAFYYDMQALNCYLETAITPEAIYALSRQLGYKRRLVTSASVPLVLYPSAVQSVPITIRRGEKIIIDDGLVFESSTDYIIPPGKSRWPDNDDLVVFVQGETREESFLSDGSAFQYFPLTHNNILQNSIEVVILGEKWDEVDSLVFIEGSGYGRDSFVGTGEDNQHYDLSLLNVFIDGGQENSVLLMVNGVVWIKVDEFTGAVKEYRLVKDIDGKTTVYFGYSEHGSAPLVSHVVDIVYKITASQKRYAVDYLDESKGILRFGDNIGGQIPASGVSILVRYRISRGILGNIRRGKIDSSIRGYLPSGASINVRAYNRESGSGGELAETLDRIKIMAPKYARTADRAVTREDYITLALMYNDPLYGSPAFATVNLKHDMPERNLIEMIVWGRDERGRIARASLPLKRAMESYFNIAKNNICTYVQVIDGAVVYFDIEADVYMLMGRSASSVSAEITLVIQNYFNSSFVEPGMELILSLINNRIQSNQFVQSSSLVSVRGSFLSEINLGEGDGIQRQVNGLFKVPGGVGVIPNSVLITDGEQVISDDGDGNLVGDVDIGLDNGVNYYSGHFIGNFANPPSEHTYISAECRVQSYMGLATTQRVGANSDIDNVLPFVPIIKRKMIGMGDGQVIEGQLPVEFTPYRPHRVVFIGGWDFYGSQPGAQLILKDDGVGNLVGDGSGFVNYDLGHFSLTWNTVPAPVVTVDYFGYLSDEPDGVQKKFDFEVRDAPDGVGGMVSLEALFGIGRLKFVFSDLSGVNVVFSDGYDDSQGTINSNSLFNYYDNTIVYQDDSLGVSLGSINFKIAPELGVGRNFKIQIVPMTLFYYTPFVAYLMGIGNYDKFVFANNDGRLLGDLGEVYPYIKLEYKTSHYMIKFSGGVAGRVASIDYDTYLSSACRNIPIDKSIMPAFSTLSLKEIF